ncbi:MAG: type I restriction enzyme HsdR N-terminal domain-containing protein [Candidatus Parvarchaeota archaeon]
MLNNKIAAFVKSINDFSQTSFITSEVNTKRIIIEDLLELLGWNKNEIQAEYPIKLGSKTVYADYAMLLSGKPVLLLEAKAFNVDLSNDDSAQIISYGRIEGIRWVVLTNGRTVKIFDTKMGKTEKECIVTMIELLKLQSSFSELNFLISKDSILTGKIETEAKRMIVERKARDSLAQRKDEIAQEFKRSLLKIMGIGTEGKVDIISKKLSEIAVQLFEKEPELSGPLIMKNKVQLMTRDELATKSDGKVILCPSRIEGVEFLKKYNAWGYIKTNKQVPYFALYVGKPESSIQYFGEVDSITEPIQSKDDIKSIEDKDKERFQAGEQVIYLKPGTLVKFKDPIPLKNRREAPRGIRYTMLGKLIKADYTDEL